MTVQLFISSNMLIIQGLGKMRGARREVQGGYSARKRARRHAIGRL